MVGAGQVAVSYRGRDMGGRREQLQEKLQDLLQAVAGVSAELQKIDGSQAESPHCSQIEKTAHLPELLVSPPSAGPPQLAMVMHDGGGDDPSRKKVADASGQGRDDPWKNSMAGFAKGTPTDYDNPLGEAGESVCFLLNGGHEFSSGQSSAAQAIRWQQNEH